MAGGLIMILSTRPITGFEARAGLAQFANLLWDRAGRSRPTIHWSSDCPSATISLVTNRVTIMAIDEGATISGSLIRKLAGLIAHEFLHRHYSQQIHASGYLHKLYNGLEDARIERRAIEDRLLGNAAGLFGSLLRDFTQTPIDWQHPGNFPFSLAVFCRDYGVPVELPQGLESVWIEAKRRVNAATDSASVLRIAEWVMAQIKDQQEDQDQGDDQGQDQGQDKGQDKGKDLDRIQTLDPEAIGHPDLSAVPQTDGEESEEHRGTAKGIKGTIERSNLGTDHPLNDAVNAQTKVALRRLLDNSGRSDLEGGRKTGLIDSRALHRSPWTDRVFSRRHDEAGIDSAIYLLVDVSDSMHFDGRIDEARNVTATIYRAALDAQASVAVGLFSTMAHTIVPFGSGRRGLATISKIIDNGSTDDLIGTRHAIRELIARPEQRKVLLVMTDGQGNWESVRRVCTDAARVGIMTLGIGIGIDVSRTYPVSASVKSAADLGVTTFQALLATLRRAA
jgi:Mg-chelatase subunit ChlD